VVTRRLDQARVARFRTFKRRVTSLRIGHIIGRHDGAAGRVRGGDDLVMGNRFRGGIEDGAMPFLHRYLGSPIINLILRTFFKVNVGDSQSGFRAFRRSLLDDLRLSSGGMELASEMIVRAAHGGFKIVEVPAPYSARAGESKLNTVRDGWRHLRFLLVAAPDFLFILPGLILFVLGALVFILSFISPAGVEIGSVSWQPIFAGTILVAIVRDGKSQVNPPAEFVVQAGDQALVIAESIGSLMPVQQPA